MSVNLIASALNPEAFSFFGMSIYWYAIIIVSGIAIAVFLSAKEAKKVGLREDDVYDFMLWALPISIIGARIYYVIFDWRDYISNPLDIFNIRQGGLAIYGGIIAGAVVVYFFTQRRYISFWKFADIAAPSILIAQSIGRWGNFMNQEAFGLETTKASLDSLHIPAFIINNMKIDGVYRQPTFLYESLWNFIGFVILIVLRRKKDFLLQGDLILFYFVWYGIGRYWIEGMRTDSLMLGGVIRISQLISILLVVCGISIGVYRHKKVHPPYYNRTLGKMTNK